MKYVSICLQIVTQKGDFNCEEEENLKVILGYDYGKKELEAFAAVTESRLLTTTSQMRKLSKTKQSHLRGFITAK